MKNFARILLLGLTSALLSSCDSAPSTGTASSPSSGTPSSGTSVPDGTPLYLSIGAKWEGGTTYELIDSCTVSAAAVSPSVTNCTVSVEEARLYYSDLAFAIGTSKASLCEIVSFRPYYYLRSNSAVYLPLGETSTIDCSVSPAPVACYGGAGPVMVPSFPTNTAMYFLSSAMASTLYTINSENSLRKYNGIPVNFLITNDLNDPTIGSSVGDEFDHVANSLRDYSITCEDRWGFVHHRLNLLIHDEDRDGSEPDAQDEYPDWQ